VVDDDVHELLLAHMGPARPGEKTSRVTLNSWGVPLSTLLLQVTARGCRITATEPLTSCLASPKIADHHIQHIYNKISVSTRAAAALWAMQHAVVR
jgi:DNA-binding CsgD family transcriptional regulator